jgi:outer membrane protein OmpA-like peptidoglycan-associated protein
MNAILNFKNAFSLTLLCAATALSAQNEIHSTATDVKYGNTTVVYTKDSNYNDQAILAQLDDSYGVGDVVRITVATPNQAASEMLASDDPAVVFAVPKATPVTTPKVIAMAPPKKAETVVVKSPVETPKSVTVPTANIGGKTVKKGSIFRLEKLYFDVDKYELKSESEAELSRLYEFLNTYPSVIIEVRGHTNNQMWPNVDFANQLSTERAKAVTDWLVAKGIAANRIQYKGYGWTMPVEPNINPEGRRKNQRVEVKVLSM